MVNITSLSFSLIHTLLPCISFKLTVSHEMSLCFNQVCMYGVYVCVYVCVWSVEWSFSLQQVVCQHLVMFNGGVQSLNATIRGAQALAVRCIHTG